MLEKRTVEWCNLKILHSANFDENFLTDNKMELKIEFENEDCLVLNKQSGISMHRGVASKNEITIWFVIKCNIFITFLQITEIVQFYFTVEFTI